MSHKHSELIGPTQGIFYSDISFKKSLGLFLGLIPTDGFYFTFYSLHRDDITTLCYCKLLQNPSALIIMLQSLDTNLLAQFFFIFNCKEKKKHTCQKWLQNFCCLF